MIIVQFRIEVEDEINFGIDYDILRREDAKELELDIANKVQAVFLKAVQKAADKAGLNLEIKRVV